MKAPMAPSAEAAVRACVALYVLAGLAGLLRFPDAGPMVDGVIAAFALALVPSASARIAVPLLALCLVAASLAGPADPARLPADLALVAVLGLVRPRHRVGLAPSPPARRAAPSPSALTRRGPVWRAMSCSHSSGRRFRRITSSETTSRADAARSGFIPARPRAISTPMAETLHIVGGGMAGSEAAWQAAEAGVPVVLHEMRPRVGTFAHKTGDLAEMVCSNSFRSDDDEQNAVGLLHWEMRAAGGLVMEMGDAHRLPAGGALAVDREAFSAAVTARIRAHPLIEIAPGEVDTLPDDGHWIIATGPLTSGALAEAIRAETGQEALAFFDAIAPIVYAETVDMDTAWRQSRYDKGETEEERTAYLNCPMTKSEYEAFIDALLAAEKTEFHEGETAGYFDGCLPIEVMAERGRETLRHGPMKPVGLTNPHAPDVKPWAVVQLRRDNALGTLYNIVGFQTKMKYGAQTEVFRMIPGRRSRDWAAFTATRSSIPPGCSTAGCG